VEQLKRHLRAWFWVVVAVGAGACDQPPSRPKGPTPPEEAQQIARALTTVVGPPAGGYRLGRAANGAQLLDLRGRLQEVMIAGRGPDGSLRTTCVSSAAEAERFLNRAAAEPGR
jgi:hypothetical protein